MVKKAFLALEATSKFIIVYTISIFMSHAKIISLIKKQKPNPLIFARSARGQKNINDLFFVMKVLRRTCRILRLSEGCLPISLVIFWMGPQESQLHFAIQKQNEEYLGHSWVTLNDQILTTDQNFLHEELLSYNK